LLLFLLGKSLYANVQRVVEVSDRIFFFVRFLFLAAEDDVRTCVCKFSDDEFSEGVESRTTLLSFIITNLFSYTSQFVYN